MASRRQVLGSAIGFGATLVPALQAMAADYGRGTEGRLVRLPKLDLESNDTFLTTIRSWANGGLQRAARSRATALMREHGLDPAMTAPREQIIALMENDPLIMGQAQLWLRNQQLMWKTLRDEFYSRADFYLSEMEAADKAGPGVLELNPAMTLPDYTKQEIHMQPGGYVGDELAGHMYHYGTNNFFMGQNYQDNVHMGLAAETPLPADKKVRRILDIGCSCGQLTVALQERFPEAEVWGLDVGGPMVRYAHMRANKLKSKARFAQRLAEDTKFPDNHFDIVTSYILFHEVHPDAEPKIMAEVNRVLRPGGVFYPIEGRMRRPQPPSSAYGVFYSWWIKRWNFEVWNEHYTMADYPAILAKAGLTVTDNEASRDNGAGNLGVIGRGTANIMGTKRA
ncbi:MAG: class I SAM-dependent methyltransferase [Rhodospirillaceae bacterium]|nr:class I SAM-dependent methyltransferase [Rhodospirillaceae bacterium]